MIFSQTKEMIFSHVKKKNKSVLLLLFVSNFFCCLLSLTDAGHTLVF